MKKRWLKAMAVTTAVLISTLSFSGCGQKTEKISNETEEDSITIFANLNPATPNVMDQAFIDEVEKATGIKINFEIPPSTNYKERLQLMLASGTYPDVVLFEDSGEASLENALKSEIIIPLNDYLDQAPNIMKYTYDVTWDALKLNVDKNIYGIPRTSISRAPGFVVRKDWLDAVGITLPADNVVSIDEFTEILKRFTKNDPDKNGKDDTFGYAGYTDGDKKLALVLENPFDLLGWQKSEADGGIYMHPMYSKNTDKYIKALEYTSSLYKSGYLDPDSFVNSGIVSIDRLKRGITGVRMDSPTNILNYEADIRKLNPSAELTYIFVENSEGVYQGTGFGTALWGLWAITTSCEKPENAIKVFDYMLSDSGWDKIVNGMEGVDYKVENGKKVYEKDSPTWSRMFVRRKADYNFFINPRFNDEERERVKPHIEGAVNAFIPSADRGFRPDVSKTPKYIEYQKTMVQVITRILIGDLPASEYRSALEGWYNAGGEEYISQMNEYINKIDQLR